MRSGSGVVYVQHEWTWWARVFSWMAMWCDRMAEKGHTVTKVTPLGTTHYV